VNAKHGLDYQGLTSIEKKYHRYDRGSCARVSRLGVNGAACCPNAESDEHANAGAQEKCSTADAIHEESTTERDEEAPYRKSAVDECLIRAPGYALDLHCAVAGRVLTW